MFPQKTKTDVTPTPLEEAIAKAFVSLDEYEATTEEYAKIIEHLEKLHKMKPEEAKSWDKNQLLAIGANLLGIVSILGYERGHVIATKALGFVAKVEGVTSTSSN